tara:strand:+ start:2920 stop:3909 length:990 start_codon:yes stop_codon:yes gene_type:complete
MNFKTNKKYNFDIDDSVNTYAGELALPYVSAALLGSETIAKNRCRFIEGIVGKTVVSGLTSTDTIQASSCNWADGSNLALTEQVLDPSDLKVNEEICRGTMYPTWIASNGRMERNGQLPATWSDFLLGAVAERTGTNLETLLWQSDTGAIFGTGFLSNDGVIDEAGINASATQGFAQHDVGTGAWTSTNILSHMGGVFAKAQDTPGILQKAGCGFYLSYEAYALFIQAMAAQNTGAGFNQSMEGANYLGYPVYPTAGIANASGAYEGAIVFTYPDNLVVGANSYTPDVRAELIPTYMYDGSDNVRVAMYFAVGVQTAVAGDGVVGFDFA